MIVPQPLLMNSMKPYCSGLPPGSFTGRPSPSPALLEAQ
jgi:hypothetical protein